MLTSEQAERLAIREMLENWVIWRDTGDWDQFRTVWHDDGRMIATWFQGTADEFIRISRDGFERGVRIQHFLGGSSIQVVGHRAIAQTRMTISQRAFVHGVECDVICTGRFFDFVENVEQRWGMVLRQPIYEKDRLDPVDPSAVLELDRERLMNFPEGYRHLAYLQVDLGYAVKADLPGLTGAAADALVARGAGWLRGEPTGVPGDRLRDR